MTYTKAFNETTSPPPLPSPLEGEGWVGGTFFTRRTMPYALCSLPYITSLFSHVFLNP